MLPSRNLAFSVALSCTAMACLPEGALYGPATPSNTPPPLIYPAPETVAAPVPSPTEPPPPEAVAHRLRAREDAALDAETDGTATRAGTPATSLRARPSWGRMDHLTIHAPRSSEYAPQVSVPTDVFLASRPVSGNLDRALVVCRYLNHAKHDTFAGDDLHARATLGPVPEMANDGPEDGNVAFVSAPLVSLKRGEIMQFATFDRDVFSLTPIARQSATFTGGPIQVSNAAAEVECRALPQDALARIVSARGVWADGVIRAIPHKGIERQSPSWGWPTRELEAGFRAAAEIASFTGWDDPRAKARVDAIEGVLTELHAATRTLFESIHPTATKSTTVGPLRVTLENGTCLIVAHCMAHVSIVNDGDQAVPLSAYFATAEGAIPSISKGLVAAKSKQRLTILLPLNANPAAQRSVLEVCIPGMWNQLTCDALRLH